MMLFYFPTHILYIGNIILYTVYVWKGNKTWGIQGVSIEMEINLQIASPLFSRPHQFDTNVSLGHSYTIILYFLSFCFSTQQFFYDQRINKYFIFIPFHPNVSFEGNELILKLFIIFIPLFSLEFRICMVCHVIKNFVNADIFGDTLDMIDSFKRQLPFILVCVSVKNVWFHSFHFARLAISIQLRNRICFFVIKFNLETKYCTPI